MFSLKKFLAPLFSPLSICVELITLGLVLLVFSRKQKTGKFLVALGMVVLVLCSYEGISGRILQTLESQYSQLDLAQMRAQENGGIATRSAKWVVVLAGGVAGDPTLPIQLQISHHSRVRLMEGIRLHHLLPGSKIILTGGIGFDGPAEATTLSRVAEELGVAKSDMILEVESRDTKDHPLYVRHLVKEEPFILVTSAFHMPRAMKLFIKQGLAPIPAPAGPWKPAKEFWSPGNLFPSASGLRLAELAYHEYMGLTWAWVRGQI
jgi:uncharacterized SAM-binding protein YcdF (DUF218 family)